MIDQQFPGYQSTLKTSRAGKKDLRRTVILIISVSCVKAEEISTY